MAQAIKSVPKAGVIRNDPPPPPPAEDFPMPVLNKPATHEDVPKHEDHEHPVQFDIDITRFKELEAQVAETKEHVDKITQAIDKLLVSQDRLAKSLMDRPIKTLTDSDTARRYKYGVKSIDGRWWYSNDIDEVRYAEWYYNRRARGIPIGAEPQDIPQRINKPAQVTNKRARKATVVYDEPTNGATTNALPPLPQKSTPAYVLPQQTYSMPYAGGYAAPAVGQFAAPASSCYSSSYQANTSAYMPQSSYAYGGGYGYQPMMSSYGGGGFGGGFGLNIGASIGSQASTYGGGFLSGLRSLCPGGSCFGW